MSQHKIDKLYARLQALGAKPAPTTPTALLTLIEKIDALLAKLDDLYFEIAHADPGPKGKKR